MHVCDQCGWLDKSSHGTGSSTDFVLHDQAGTHVRGGLGTHDECKELLKTHWVPTPLRKATCVQIGRAM